MDLLSAESAVDESISVVFVTVICIFRSYLMWGLRKNRECWRDGVGGGVMVR